MNERIFAVAHLADQGVLLLLVILSLVSLVMIMERWLVLKRVVARSQKHKKILENAISRRDLGSVREIAADQESVEGRAMAYAIDHIESKGTYTGVEEIFAAIGTMEKPKLERSLGFLATVGSNGPYIGLFGTVLGIMKAFHDMANAADAGQQTVMAGISGALIATAAGLLVAIPAVLAYNYFQKQVKSVMASLDSCRDMVLAWAKQREA
jgi:biopolymer transport protein TolQ